MAATATGPQGVPSSGMLAQIQAQIRQEQLDRIKELGTAKLIGATAPGDAMNNALAAFQKQRQLGSEEDLRQAQLAQAQSWTAAQNIKNQSAQAEETYMGGIDPQTGLSHRDELLGAQGKTAQLNQHLAELKLTEEPETHAAQMNLSDAQLNAAHDQSAASRWATADSKTQSLAQQFRGAVAGYAGDPATRDQKTSQMINEYAAQGMNPDLLSGEAKSVYREVDAARANGQLAQQVGFYSGPNGSPIRTAGESGLADVNKLQSAVQLRNQYQNSLRVPGVEVNLNQKGPATDARNNFADMMEGMGAKSQADDLRSDLSLDSVSGKMNAFLGNTIPQAEQNWNNVTKASIKPEYTSPQSPTYDGYIKNVDNAFSQLNSNFTNGSSGAAQNIKMLGQQPAQQPAANPGQYLNPGSNPGAATATPAAAPAAAPPVSSYGPLPEAQ